MTVKTTCGPCAWIGRDGGGLLKVWPDEVHPLIDALSKAADVVTETPLERHQIVEAVSPQGGTDEYRH